MTDWVRLWHDMPTDPKWRVIARKSGQPLPCVLALFTLMLTNASGNAAERGVLLAWDHEDAGAALDMEPEAIEAIYDAMQGKVLDGNKLTGWDRRQPKREDNSSARVAKHRNDKKRDVTQSNAPETDTETDEKEELSPNGDCASDDALKPEHVVDAWNDLATRMGKPTVRDLTPERRQRLKARIAGYSLDDWRSVLGAVERSAFLRGDTGWHGCTFDWITKKANFQKTLEGNYNDKPSSATLRH